MKIREVLTDESQWCQHYMALDSNGKECLISDRQVTRRCLAGWAAYCYPDLHTYYEVCNKLAIKTQYTAVTTWNDQFARTFAEVKALVEELDI